MSQNIPTALRKFVKKRADNKCEYCLIHETFSPFTHEIDHVVATKHGGQTSQENLALSCLSCNRHKGSDLTSIDPITGNITQLFNPRGHDWNEHFQINNGSILGLTAVGRTSIFLLKLNDPKRLQLRQTLAVQGLYPNLN